MRLNLSEICHLANIEKIEGDPKDIIIESVCTDSRECKKGSLFICIKGKNLDGHDYIHEAIANGAVAILSEREINGLDVPVLVVNNCIQGLGEIANYWRRKTNAFVIGVTGSAGKTTLKDLLFHLLNKKAKSAKSILNLNNQIGLPLSMLSTDGDEKYWIMEIGISQPGDMEDLGKILKPDLAIILNVGAAHLEGLGQAGVAAHKSLLLKFLSDKGQALICGDYTDLVEESAKYNVPCEKFYVHSQNDKAHWHMSELDKTGAKGAFCLDGEKINVPLPLPGRAGAEIVLAALGCLAILNLDFKETIKTIDSFELPDHRFNEQVYPPWHIVDDTYNANPLSMERMLKAAYEKASNLSLPLFLILGELYELGDESSTFHEKLGEEIGKINPAYLFYKGNFIEEILKGIHKYNSEFSSFTHICENINLKELLIHILFQQKYKTQGGVILLKGSRANRLDLISQQIKNMLSHAK